MLREFFGIGGYQRAAEGFLSWQHITFVTAFMIAMIGMAIFFGKRDQGKTSRDHNKVLMITAVVMDGTELLRIVLNCFFTGDWMSWLHSLPLYMCSIQFITLPLAAFSNGRFKQASMDFVCIFGLLGAVVGTYCAGNNYGTYPVICFDNVVSSITHAAAGFASLYILQTGMASMKRNNVLITCGIIIGFAMISYAVNVPLGSNYMFLMRGDGTPYDILYRWFSGNKVLYPLSVVFLFILYIGAFYKVFNLIRRHRK